MNTVTTTDQRSHTLGMVQVALFGAIIVVLAFTPFLGYIPLGFTRATIIHIPVILGSLMLGPKKGAVLGGVFGLTSLINNTMNPTVTSFVFSPFYSLGEIHGGIGSLIICMIPRILVGVIPFFVYHGILKLTKKSNNGFTLALGAAGLSGALTNTLLVMNLIFLFYGDAYASVNNVASDAVYKFILSIIGINGIPEAIVAAVIITCIGRILMKTKYAFNE
ncbi:MAG: ECF transporter S component [Lachnospiraceae bacterium]